MGKIRRGGYVFLSWKGDHSPQHVFKDSKLIVKWDLENWLPMKGQATRRIIQLLRELVREGAL